MGAVLCMVGLVFVRGAPRPGRPRDEPARWKLVVWMILFVALLPTGLILAEILAAAGKR